MFTLEGMLKVVIAGLCLFLLYAAVALPRAALTERECLQLGYREGRVDVLLARYCVTRVDQTDRVVPLERARQEADQ